MKEIMIIHKPRLIDGETYNNGIANTKTEKEISISLLYQYDKQGKKRPCLYLQIGNFLEKDFKDYILFDDTIYIK